MVAEHKARATAEELRNIVDHGPCAIFRVDVDRLGARRIVFAVTGPNGFAGYSEAEWLAMSSCLDIVHQADAGALPEHYRARDEQGEGVLDYRLRHKDGHYIWIRDAATVIAAPDGSCRTINYVQDITAEKLQAEQLTHAQKLLSMGELVSGIGHELGQPLAAISLAAEVGLMGLKRQPPSLTLVESKFERILAMTERAVSIIDHMRASNLDEVHHKSVVVVDELLTAAMTIMQDRVRLEDIRFTTDVPAGMPAVSVPVLLFQQVLINLISNACDAYHGSERERVVALSARPKSDGTVSIFVRDHAGGIPEQHLTRIFEPFFTTKGPDRGTGLGLSMCYAIVRKAGGELSVYNENDGAVFEIVIPAVQASSTSDLTAVK
jgi:PAS domain S-box-containing protein